MSGPVAGGAGAADPLLPLWTAALGVELRRGCQVIVHGDVNDRFWMQGQPVTFRQLVANYLTATGAQVVGWWDPVDGLGFPLAGHREAFDEMVHALGRTRDGRGPGAEADRASGRRGGLDMSARVSESGPDGSAEMRAATGTRGADPSPAGGEDSPAGGRAGAARLGLQRLAGRGGPNVRYSNLNDTLDVVRRLAATPSACAFVLQDMDVALPADGTETGGSFLRLRAAMADAVVPADVVGQPPYRRNPVITVVGDLSRVPTWFYQEDPRVAVLEIARPNTAERRLWLSMIREDFNGARSDDDVEPLVAATDGMAAWHLDALARTSTIRAVPVLKPSRLLEAHRFHYRSNPWEQLDQGMVRDAGERLRRRVIGQNRAVDAVADALQTAYVGVDFGTSGAARPRGVFFFVGPTGVGKTELAKAVAELVFGDEGAYARFDMSEYQQEHAAERLAGAPPGYVGYEQGGELTRRVQERPFSVLLFDEIEKADKAVLDKFLQILEDGRLTDGRGQTAYFSQCLIIFTSNTGADGLYPLLADTEEPPAYEVIERHFIRAVEEKFRQVGRPEIYGRLRPGVVVFDMLRSHHVAGIADRLLAQLAESVQEKYRVELVVDHESVYRWMAERMAEPARLAYGGRQIRNELESLRLAVVRHWVASPVPPGGRLGVSVTSDGTIAVEMLDTEPPDARPPDTRPPDTRPSDTGPSEVGPSDMRPVNGMILGIGPEDAVSDTLSDTRPATAAVPEGSPASVGER